MLAGENALTTELVTHGGWSKCFDRELVRINKYSELMVNGREIQLSNKQILWKGQHTHELGKK